MFGQHIQNIASFFGTFDVSLPFARPLSDKLGRRISVLIGAASYVIFFIGIAFSPNIQVAYVAAVLGGIANSFLDTATYPAVTEIIHKFTGIATMGIKFFISIAQLLMPFFLGVAAGTSLSYAALPVAGGIAIGILGVLAIFAPMPAGNAAAKSESFISSLKNANFSVESIALILIASSLCNYTILSAAAKMSSMQVIMMNIVITVIGVLLAVFVNVRYGSLLAKTEQ